MPYLTENFTTLLVAFFFFSFIVFPLSALFPEFPFSVFILVFLFYSRDFQCLFFPGQQFIFKTEILKLCLDFF